jgi:hypothetical protein
VPPRRRRRGLAVVATTAVVAALAGAGWWVLRPDPPVELPPSAQGAELTALQGYLAAAGKPLVDVADALQQGMPTADEDQCAGLQARLTSLGSPKALGELAAGVPDPAVRDSVLATVAAASDYVGTCDQAEKAEAAFQVDVLDRLLAANGVQSS